MTSPFSFSRFRPSQLHKLGTMRCEVTVTVMSLLLLYIECRPASSVPQTFYEKKDVSWWCTLKRIAEDREGGFFFFFDSFEIESFGREI